MSREFDIPESHVIVAGTEYRLLGSAFAAGGQASLYEAVAKNSDVSRRFLIKRFHDSGDYSEEFESEELSQKVAANVHQAILAAAFHDKKQHTSIMLKASSDCSTVQDILIAWEDVPPEDPASDYFDMGRFLESIQIVKSLLGALSGIHKHGVLHMDVSPSNVMWGRTEAHGTAYLLDFSCCTKTGSIVGERRRTTLSFSSPEAQIPGTVLTPAADIYSVGAVFLLLVAGMAAASNNRSEKKWSIRRLPGEGNTNVTDRVDDLDIPDAYKGKLSEIIIKATTSVDKRYQSAPEMLADMVELERIIAGRGMTPETLVRGSAALFRKECDNENGIFHYELQDDLITEAVDFDRNTPVDILIQNTILLGSGGSGKTTKVRKLWEQCLSDWKKDRKNNPIPVYVPLNTFDSRKSNWDFFIRDYITEVYFPGLSMDVSQRREDLIGMFESAGKYILFLDGINETVDSSMLNAEIAKLAAIKNVTVIITSRNNWGDDETKKLFSIAELMPLNDDLVLRKLQENGLGSPSARLMETLHRPMFLALYLQIKITDNAVETPGQILLAHHKYLIDAYKTGHHGEDWELVFELILNDFLPNFVTAIDRLAFEANDARDCLAMLVRKLKKEKNTKYKIEDAQVFLKKVKQPIGKAAITLLMNCGIFKKTSRSTLTIAHQNYFEFYQALDVYNQIQALSKGSRSPKALSNDILPSDVIRFLGDLFAEYRWERELEPPSAIENWLREHAAGKSNEATQIVIRNLVETMKVARNGHISADYGGLDLALVNFKNCDLTGSKFSKAVLPDAALQHIGHYKTADQLAFVPGKSWILSSSCREKDIYIWNYRLGILVDRIPCEENVLGFDVSEDGSYVAVKEQSNGNYLAEVFNLVNRKRMRRIPFAWPDSFTIETLDECISESNAALCDLRTESYSLLDEDEMLQNAQTAISTFLSLKPIFETLQHLEPTAEQEKYHANHTHELKQFHEAQEYLVMLFPDGKIDRQQLAIRRSEIKIHFGGILDRIECKKQQLDKLLTLKSFRTSQRYRDAVIRFGKDNKLICSFGPNGTDEICIWDLADTGNVQPISQLPIRSAYENPDCMTQKCVLSFDRKDMFCLSEEGQLVAVNLESGNFRTYGILPIGNDLGFTLTRKPDRLLFVDAKDTLCYFDLQQKTIVPLCEMVISLPVVAKDYLVWAQGSFLFGWDIYKEQQEQYPIWGITCLCVDPTGDKVAFSTSDGTIRIGDLEEKRIVIDFSSGLGELYCSHNPNLIDLSGLFQETKAVSWNKSGLIRQRYRNQACCLSGNTGRIISFPRSYFNTFDGSYTISVEIVDCTNSVIETSSSAQRYISASEKIVVRNIETGELVAEAPWTPVCVAKDKAGQEFFQERSGIRWARYLPDHKKIVIGMNLALVQIWNLETQTWISIGNWDVQIQKIAELPDVKNAKDIGRKAWQLSASCTVLGSHIITGTVEGHIVFWSLDGKLIKDAPAHDNMPDIIRKIPMSSLFLSIENGMVCIWNYEFAKMVDSGKTPHYVTEQNMIGACDCASWQLEPHSVDYHETDGSNLVIIAERYDETVLIGCGYREASQASMGLLGVHTKMSAMSYDGKKVAFILGSSIEVYSLETCQLISEIDFSEHHLFNITDVCFSPNGDSLAIIYSDARVLIFDLEHKVSRLWDVVSASSILRCDFSDAIMSEKTRTLLQQNGATF